MLSSDSMMKSVRTGWTSSGSNDSTLAGDGQPLRAELFSVGQLERHAKALAGQHEISAGRPVRRPRLLERLGDNQAMFVSANTLLTEAAELGRQISPAAEWFIDNFHLIEDQIQTTRRHLPRAYHRELPQLVNAQVPGTPRVYDLAIELISHSHGRVDKLGLMAFVEAYQSLQPLRLGELWAIPIMLRLALIENLRRVVASVTSERRDRELAGRWIGELAAALVTAPNHLVLVLAKLVSEAPNITNAFVAELASRLQSQGPGMAIVMSWLEQRLVERGQTVEHAFHLASQSLAADQVSVSNSIGSLRFLDATDWRDFVESTSFVEQVLRGDPAGVYADMDFASRDRYRHVVEAVARRCSASEEEVARAAIRLARESGGHVGTFLISDERRALEHVVGVRTSLMGSVHEGLRRSRAGVYAGSILAMTALTLLAFLLAAPYEPSGWWCVPWWLSLTLCSSMVALAIVNTAATLFVGPTTLPRLDFSKGIPEAHRTIVAIPTMLTDINDIDALVESLEVRFLANRDKNLSFALLSDLRDAAAETMPGDEALIEHASTAISELNLKYRTGPDGTPTQGPTLFFLLHRPRKWNPAQGVWMGWERKRGKLEDFNTILRGIEGGFSHIVGEVSELAKVRYVIALDSDTDLPRDAARLLAATMAHPLNRPHFDEAKGRVTSGYSILQPRVGVSMASTSRTRFARLFAGEPGIDPYTRAVSDVFQDVFEEGSFVGKGIYDVDMLRRALTGRLPDNRILSHDLLEGAYARAGLVSDIELVEDFPSSFAADVSRRTRWIRGDWQIASWLLPRVSARSGTIKNPVSWLSRWKILDNLRRSIMPIALFGLLVGGWFIPGVAAFATISTILVLLVPGLLVAATAFMRRPPDQRRGAHLRDLTRSAIRQFGREAFALATLPYDALLALQAIGQTLWRLSFTKRHLLVWCTAMDAQRNARTSLSGTYASMWSAPAIGVIVATALSAWAPASLPWAGPVLLSWIFAPGVAWWLSRPLMTATPRLTPDDLRFLRGVARRTWRFFETFVTARDNHLPPDNFQEDPAVGSAHRTSPTNIGLALTANLAAFDFGYLTAGGLIARTSLALEAIDRLATSRSMASMSGVSRRSRPTKAMP